MNLRPKTRSPLAEDGKKSTYYRTYSVLFLVLAFCCFSWVIFSGKSLIWAVDGWNQHFKALVYYSMYLRKIFRTLLLERRLVIPEWDFTISEGADILTVLHYYVIGDPITLFSALVPPRFLQYFYSASCVLRLYLAGIAFSALCFGTGQKNRYGILAGALAYSFCAWGLLCAARHPYFLNPMIYFPLILLGMEKILRKEKPYCYVLSVAVSAASNFYFFYIIVVLTVVYAMIRLAYIYIYKSSFRNYLLALLRLAGYALIGAMIAGILLLPMLMVFLYDSRMGSAAQSFHWLYPLSYYTSLPGIFLSPASSYWLYIGLTAPTLLAAIALFLEKRQHRLLKVLFAVGVGIMLFPICGRILNGMSYMSNRWSWAFALLCSYILVCEWESLLTVSGKKWAVMLACSGLLCGICLRLGNSRSRAVECTLLLVFLSLLLIRTWRRGKPIANTVKARLLLLIVAVGLVNQAFWRFAPDGWNYVSELVANRAVWENWGGNETALVKAVSGGKFARYSGRSLGTNVNFVSGSGISNTQYYWTISNPYVSRFRSEMAMREDLAQYYEGYDDRTTLNALAAVQYYTVPNSSDQGLPYGYDPIDTNLSEDYSVYRNRYALPIGYCYDAVLSDAEWQELNPVQKQESMLEAAYVSTPVAALPQYENAADEDYLLPYKAECRDEQVVQTDSGFVTTDDGREIVLTLEEDTTNSEVYVSFEGLNLTATPAYDLYFGDETVDPLNLYGQVEWDILSEDAGKGIQWSKRNWSSVVTATITVESSAGVKKSFQYKSDDASFSSGRHDYIVNLGYMEESITSVTITLPIRGIYTLDNLRVYRIPMEGYAGKIAKLQENTLQNVTYAANSLQGEITVDSPKLLCIATPYSAGWTGSVDGVETEVYCVNGRYLGLLIPEGAHTVSMHYATPYKKAGTVISLLGAAAFCTVVLYERKKRRKKDASLSNETR